MVFEKISNINKEIYHNFLLDTLIDENITAYGAKISDDFAVGVILAKKDELERKWNITTFFVSSFFRNSGVGTTLLNYLIKDLKNKDCTTLCLNIVTSKKTFDILKDFLLKRGFKNPETLTDVYRFSKDILKSNFVRACLISKNPFDNIDFVPIQKVPKKILEDLRNNEDITYPKILSLFANENNLEHVNSLVAIKNKENVVGWISGLLAPGDMILYRSFFVDENHRKNALGLALLNEALKIHLNKFINLEGLCAVSIDNHRVKKFVSIYFKDNFKYIKHEYKMTMNLK